MRRFKLFAMSLLATLALLLAACGGGGEETAPGAPGGELPGATGTEQAVPGQQATQPSASGAETEDATAPAAGTQATKSPSETESMTDTEQTKPAAGPEETKTPSETESMTDTEDTDTPAAEETETLGDSDAMTDTTDAESSAAAEAGLQSSTVADFSVMSSDDQQLGSIEDLVLDPQDGQVKYALVSLNSGVGLTVEVIPVPWEHLKLQGNNQQAFVLDANQQTLQEAPSFDEFPPAQSGWESEVEQYWKDNASISDNSDSQ